MSTISIIVPHKKRPVEQIYTLPPHKTRLRDAIAWLAQELSTTPEELLESNMLIVNNVAVINLESAPELDENTQVRLMPILIGG